MMRFDLPEQSSIIKVIGVGGGGSNAVNHMYRLGINGVNFIVCNTDKQALDISPVPHKITLGEALTEGRGAGSMPEVGKQAAMETIEQIKDLLANNTRMVFITAGMGGGTGTGAAPVIAKIAKEMGILTVGIVTVPFSFEGKKRRQQAEEGLAEMKANCDTLLVICNDKLREMFGNLKMREAFSHADNVLSIAAKSIAEIISLTQQINVDFADVRTVMRDSGVAIMGSASASGEGRALKAVQEALNSPLLNDNNISGARYVLLNITSGSDEITMDELGEITDYIQDEAGQTAELIKGYGVDETLGDKVNVTVIATGFQTSSQIPFEISSRKPEKIVLKLEDEKTAVAPEVTEPVAEKKEEVVAEKENNPLEPFLINKAVAEEKQVTMEFEPRIETVIEETFLAETVISETVVEPVAEVSTAPVAESNTVIESIVSEIEEDDSTETFIEMNVEETPEVIWESPVTQYTEELILDETPVGGGLAVEVSEEETPSGFVEPVSEISVEPVSEVSSEIESVHSEEVVSETESSVEEEESSFVLSADESAKEVVFEITPEPMKEEIQEPVFKKTEEPVAEAKKVEEPVAETKSHEEIEAKKQEEIKRVDEEDQKRKAYERILRLKELSLKLKTPNGLAELEQEPAFVRRKISLENTPHSSESQVSKYTLTENDEKKSEIKPNNSFLHDNVD
jgi:cell division protein FtsZ